jgi:hypothetical protein
MCNQDEPPYMGCIPDDFKEDDPSLFGEMMPLIFMGVFDNSVPKMYLLNTQLSFHQNSFDYFILFIPFIKRYIYRIVTVQNRT